MQKLLDLWRSEPALIVGFVQAALVLAVGFGLNLTADQQAAILAFAAALLALLGAGVTRQNVYSPNTYDADVATALRLGDRG